MTRRVFTSVELTTDAVITLDLTSNQSNAQWTKLTLQIVDGVNASTAGIITIMAKVDKQNVDASFHNIGSFDLTSKVPQFIEGSYEELQFTGTSMTAAGTTVLTNGDFGAGLGAEWTLTPGATDGTIIITTGELVFDQLATAETMTAIQSFTTVIGEKYDVSFDLVSASDTAASTRVLVGTTSGASDLVNNVNTAIGAGQTFTFVATGTTTYITLEDTQIAAATSVWDNISVLKTGSSAYIVVAAHSG